MELRDGRGRALKMTLTANVFAEFHLNCNTWSSIPQNKHTNPIMYSKYLVHPDLSSIGLLYTCAQKKHFEHAIQNDHNEYKHYNSYKHPRPSTAEEKMAVRIR